MKSVLGLIIGDPFGTRTWSGSSRRFFGAFRQISNDLVVRDVDLSKIEKMLYASPHFSFNNKKWRQRYVIHPLTFKRRSSIAIRTAEKYGNNVSAILQIGAMFKTDIYGMPLFTYCDGNLAISMKGIRSFTEYVPEKILEKVFTLEKSVYERCSMVFTFSEWLRRSMIEDFGLPENKVFAAGGGPNLDLSLGDDINKSYHEKNILFVGIDFYRKGGDTLMEAFEIASREIRDLKLTIAGTGPIPGINSKRIEFVGFIDKTTEEGIKKLVDLYRNASLFVMPSLFEPFGVVFLEAMLFKLPCIGSSVCAMPEIIDDGETGFLSPPGDAKLLANKIVMILKEPSLLKEMGRKGYEKVMSKYNWLNVARSIHTCIQGKIP